MTAAPPDAGLEDAPLSAEEVSYVSGDAEVSGWLYRPDNTEPAPAVVFAPGFTGTRYAAFYQPYVRRLVTAGYAVLLADYRGWGDSGGPRGEIVPLRQVADVRSGLTYLQTRDEIDPDRLALFGVSFGGGNVIHAAAVDERVRAVVAVSPVVDGAAWLRAMRREYEWQELLDAVAGDARGRVLGKPPVVVDPTEGILVSTPERRATTVKGSVPAEKVPTSTPLWCAQEVMEFRPVELAARISPGALLLFYVTRDAVVPGEQARSAYAAAREPKKLVRLVGDKHYAAYLEHFHTIVGESLSWLDAYAR